MKKFTRLTNHGSVPANTVCPFTLRCPIFQQGDCIHKGVAHAIDFSCAVARAIDIWDKYYQEEK